MSNNTCRQNVRTPEKMSELEKNIKIWEFEILARDWPKYLPKLYIVMNRG